MVTVPFPPPQMKPLVPSATMQSTLVPSPASVERTSLFSTTNISPSSSATTHRSRRSSTFSAPSAASPALSSDLFASVGSSRSQQCAV